MLGRAQAARLLHRRHLLFAGRHVVHLHVVVDRLRTGRLLGYRRVRWAISGVSEACEGRKGLRTTACAHRHGRVELVDLGLDRFH